MIKSILLFIFAALLVNAGVTPSPNPQQARCAQPPRGCSSQRKPISCTNWNGCKWSCDKVTTGDGLLCENSGQECISNNCCSYNAACAIISPTKSPTKAPTPPTLPPTHAPVKSTHAPTASPTLCNDIPQGGCSSQHTFPSCGKFHCCHWVGGKPSKGGICMPISFSGPVPCSAYGSSDHAGCRSKSYCKVLKGKCINK
jgi:hypothetical protein